MTEHVSIPRVVIAAAGSGSGKTTVTCALLSALKKRSLKAAACKCGPDYIDPMFHTGAIGISSKNIDSFFCDENQLVQQFALHANGFDITVCEGVMGYYDGLSMDDTAASTYDIASKIKAPVLLVINAGGMALTAASIIKGIADFRTDSNIKGVILNNISPAAGKRYEIEQFTGIPVVGCLPPMPRCAFDSRHLGLIPDEDIEKKLDLLSDAAEKYIDIDRIINIAKSADTLPLCTQNAIVREKVTTIAVARDEAFCFLYKDNIELLESLGCNIVYFSPMRDKYLPKADGLILGGGYPELYLDRLSSNDTMLCDIRQRLTDGMPCLAECGGFMYLHRHIRDNDSRAYGMAGFIDADAFPLNRLVRFGYVTLTAKNDTAFLNIGGSIKAHEFHYWDSTDNGSCFKAEKPAGNRSWDCMHSIKNTLCGFPHIYYPSNAAFAENFVSKCFERGIK